MNLTDIFTPLKMKFTPVQQMDKIHEEVGEAVVELDENNRQKLLYELVDVVQATVQMMYVSEYSPSEINNAVELVKNRNRERGKYAE